VALADKRLRMSLAPPALAGDVVVPDTPSLVGAEVTASAISHAADKINEQHRLAQSVADTAVDHAIECGRLLLEQQRLLGYGNFGAWIKANCAFSLATAGNYVRVARNPNALGKSRAIRQLYPSGQKRARKALPAPSDVQASAAAPPSATAAATGDDLNQAIALLKSAGTSDGRRRIAELVRTDRLVKLSRRRLERAEIAQRNAQASVLAAARKLQGAGE
jgi:hypothetical protein